MNTNLSCCTILLFMLSLRCYSYVGMVGNNRILPMPAQHCIYSIKIVLIYIFVACGGCVFWRMYCAQHCFNPTILRSLRARVIHTASFSRATLVAIKAHPSVALRRLKTSPALAATGKAGEGNKSRQSSAAPFI